jgi:hypothetical protein
VCRAEYQPDWVLEDFEEARDLALIELARCGPFEACDITIARCGDFDRVQVFTSFSGYVSYHLSERAVGAEFFSDTNEFCGGASFGEVWAAPGFLPLVQHGCPIDCYYDGTGEPACEL